VDLGVTVGQKGRPAEGGPPIAVVLQTLALSKEKTLAVSTGAQQTESQGHDRISRSHVPGDDAARMRPQYRIQHLVEVVHGHLVQGRSGGPGLIGDEVRQLLSGLTRGREGARAWAPPKLRCRAGPPYSRGEGDALGDALVDDVTDA